MGNAKTLYVKKILLLLLFFQLSNLFGQNPNWNQSKVCNQVNLALKHIAEDKIEKVKKVKLQDSINDGRNYDRLMVEYVAYKLNTDLEKVFDYSPEKTNLHFDKIEKASYTSFKLDSGCVKNIARKPNAYLSKLDDETLVINIVTDNINTNEGASGVTYLFCFDGEKLIRVFKKHWIS